MTDRYAGRETISGWMPTNDNANAICTTGYSCGPASPDYYYFPEIGSSTSLRPFASKRAALEYALACKQRDLHRLANQIDALSTKIREIS